MRKLPLGVAALSFRGCQKDQNLQEPNLGGVKSKTPPEERYEDYTPPGDVEPTIQNFINAAESQSLDPMPLNEAV